MNLKSISLVLFLLSSAIGAHAISTLDLSGTWQLELDPDEKGIAERWYQRELSDTMTLPGSTDEAGLGHKNGPETAFAGRLAREFTYEGAAWYKREIEVPTEWVGKPMELYLERVHMVSDLWVNGEHVGSANSLSAAHRYDLSDALKAGSNTLALRIVNQIDVNLGRWSHSSSDETLGNWNGVVGKLELRAFPEQYLSNVRVGSDLSRRVIWVDGKALQREEHSKEAALSVRIVDPETGQVVSQKSQQLKLSGDEKNFQLELEMPADIKLWDEFNPKLYRADVRLSSQGSAHQLAVDFGVREMTTADRQFVINGRPTFMRGNLQCGAFPLTGYFSMERAYWEKIIKTSKAYGLNHFRFHSYNPPHIAYEVASELGFYFCTEAPFWSKFKGDSAEGRYLTKEAFRMIEEYGNHASFVMMGLGNEIGGDNPFLSNLLKELKATDGRRLYNSDINEPGIGKRKEPIPEAEFFVTRWTKSKGSTLRLLGKRFLSRMATHGTDADFKQGVADLDVPLISHELGQWAVHPSYAELPKYTGVMQPYNLQHFKRLMELNGMLPQAEAIARASGRLAAQLYREDMEMCLRTPNMGGYQLLQLQDFPGQGDSLIGLLDVFWDSKGIITPEEFRQSSSETVLLARFPNFVLSNAETFTAQIHVANYGPADFEARDLTWSLTHSSDAVVASGALTEADIPTGNVYEIGSIQVALNTVTEASQLNLKLSLAGSDYENNYPLWVYPDSQDSRVPSDILLTRTYDQAAKEHLRQGGSVLLSVPHGARSDDYFHLMRRAFRPIFWNYLWRGNRNFGDLGILVDPTHPALQDFPTDEYASWQWSELLNGSHAFVLNELPDDFQPIVQSIDDFHRAFKLGALFEAKAGNGKIMLTGIDLHNQMHKRRVATQLRSSLLAYMQSDAFQPEQEIDLDILFEKSIAARKNVTFATSTVSAESAKGPRSELEIIQGELDEFSQLRASKAAAEGAGGAFDLNWKNEWYFDGTQLPQEAHIDLSRVAALNGIVYKPANRSDHRVRRLSVYAKTNENAPWGAPVLEYTQLEDNGWFKALAFDATVQARYLRFVIHEGATESRVLSVGEFEPWFK